MFGSVTVEDDGGTAGGEVVGGAVGGTESKGGLNKCSHSILKYLVSIHTHTHIHIHTHTEIHTYTYIHTHTHTHIYVYKYLNGNAIINLKGNIN